MRYLVAFGLLAAGLLFLSRPVIPKCRNGHNRVEAMFNAKEILQALQDFEAEYGEYPNATTAPVVAEKTGTSLALSAGSSNQIFRQLIAAGLKCEMPFYAKASYSHKPDENFSDDAHAIAPGECGFAYVCGLKKSDDPRTPILLAPIIPGKFLFEQGGIDGKAMMLCLNGDAIFLPIGPTGHAVLNDMDLFDPRQPFWNGKIPDLKWPE